MPLPIAAGLFLTGYGSLLAAPFVLVNKARPVNSEFPDFDELVDLDVEESDGEEGEGEVGTDKPDANREEEEEEEEEEDDENHNSKPGNNTFEQLFVEWEDIDDGMDSKWEELDFRCRASINSGKALQTIVVRHLTVLKVMATVCKLLRICETAMFGAFVIFVEVMNHSEGNHEQHAILIALTSLVISVKTWGHHATPSSIIAATVRINEKTSLSVDVPNTNLILQAERYVLFTVNADPIGAFPFWDWVSTIAVDMGVGQKLGVYAATVWVLLRSPSPLFHFYYTPGLVKYLSLAVVLATSPPSSALPVFATDRRLLSNITAMVRNAIFGDLLPISPAVSSSSSGSSAGSKRKRSDHDDEHLVARACVALGVR